MFMKKSKIIFSKCKEINKKKFPKFPLFVLFILFIIFLLINTFNYTYLAAVVFWILLYVLYKWNIIPNNRFSEKILNENSMWIKILIPLSLCYHDNLLILCFIKITIILAVTFFYTDKIDFKTAFMTSFCVVALTSFLATNSIFYILISYLGLEDYSKNAIFYMDKNTTNNANTNEQSGLTHVNNNNTNIQEQENANRDSSNVITGNNDNNNNSENNNATIQQEIGNTRSNPIVIEEDNNNDVAVQQTSSNITPNPAGYNTNINRQSSFIPSNFANYNTRTYAHGGLAPLNSSSYNPDTNRYTRGAYTATNPRINNNFTGTNFAVNNYNSNMQRPGDFAALNPQPDNAFRILPLPFPSNAGNEHWGRDSRPVHAIPPTQTNLRFEQGGNDLRSLTNRALPFSNYVNMEPQYNPRVTNLPPIQPSTNRNVSWNPTLQQVTTGNAPSNPIIIGDDNRNSGTQTRGASIPIDPQLLNDSSSVQRPGGFTPINPPHNNSSNASTHQTTVGNTPSNPIVIENEGDNSNVGSSSRRD